MVRGELALRRRQKGGITLNESLNVCAISRKRHEMNLYL